MNFSMKVTSTKNYFLRTRIFIVSVLGYIHQCSGVTLGSSFKITLEVLEGSCGMLGIEPRSAKCKAHTYPLYYYSSSMEPVTRA